MFSQQQQQQHSPSEGGDGGDASSSVMSLDDTTNASDGIGTAHTGPHNPPRGDAAGGDLGGRGGSRAVPPPPPPPPPDASPLPPSLSDRLAVMGGATDGLLPAEGLHVGAADGPWDVEQARTALRDATVQLGRRGLKLASKWAAEQMVGLVPPLAGAGTGTGTGTGTAAAASAGGNNFATSGQESEATNDLELLAKSLLECGELRAAASALSSLPISSNDPSSAAGPANAINGGASSTAAKAARAAVAIGGGRIGGGGGTGDSSGDLVMGPPLPGLSALGTYLRAYSLYMAGEKRREEEMVELRDPLDRGTSRNAVLPQLASELYIPYVEGALDAFGLYIYGVVLKALRSSSSPAGLTTRSPTSVMRHDDGGGRGSDAFPPGGHPSAHTVLIESVLLYPYNWSAWLDLSGLCIDDPAIHPDVEDRLRPISGHWMYHFFCVHVFLENQANENAVSVIERLVNGNSARDPFVAGGAAAAGGASGDAEIQQQHPDGMFGRSPYLQSQLAVAQYNLRDFDEAEAHFVALSERYPDRLDQMDVYSNILYVKEDRVTLSALAHRAVRVDKYRPETCCIVGNYYSLRGRHERAVTYFQRALKLDPAYLSAWTLMGHEYVEMKNTPAAVEAYRRAVDINPRDYRAWYGLEQTYEILDMLLYALFYFRRAATLRPYDARMWCAMGGCYLGLGRRADAIRSYERAVSNHDSEGIATRKLAELYKEDDDVEGAARCYLRHLELRFQAQGGGSGGIGGGDGQEGSAAGVDGGDSMPSIDTVINLVEVNAAEAEALLYLAYYHRDNGEFETAAACCSRLLEYPGQEKEEGKALLREIRSRMDKRKAAAAASSGGGMTLRSRSRSRSRSTSSSARKRNPRRGGGMDDSMDDEGGPDSSFDFASP